MRLSRVGSVIFLSLLFFSFGGSLYASKRADFELSKNYIPARFYPGHGNAISGLRVVPVNSGTYTYTVTTEGELADHIDVTPTAFTMTAPEDQYLSITITGGLPAGEFDGRIAVRCNETGKVQECWVYVASSYSLPDIYTPWIEIPYLPQEGLSINNTYALNLTVISGTRGYHGFFIKNDGGAWSTLDYYTTIWDTDTGGPTPDWISPAFNDEGSLLLGQSSQMLVDIDATNLGAGQYDAWILVWPNNSNAQVNRVHVNLNVINF